MIMVAHKIAPAFYGYSSSMNIKGKPMGLPFFMPMDGRYPKIAQLNGPS
jgi:hypothetical protein